MVTRIPLDNVCMKKIPTLSLQYDGLIDYIDISSVDNAKKRIASMQCISAKDAPSRAKQLLKVGDILVSTVRPNLNAVAMVEQQTDNLLVGSTGYCVIRCNDNVDKRYVFYFCQSPYFIDDMTSQATGASYPAVSSGIVKSSAIPNHPMEMQKQIADRLDKVTELIALRKEQLAKLEQLVKARFVEMFGVPGNDDFGWGMVSLGSVCYINPKKSQDPRLSGGVEVSFVPMSAVTERGEIDTTTVKKYDEVKTGFTYFAENDVLFAKITPCMENGKGAVARGLCNGIGFGSTEFHVLRPIKGQTNPYWIYMLTVFSQFREDAANNMTGSAGQRRVPASFLENYRVAVPPIELQEHFSAFVEQTEKSKLTIQQSLDKLEVMKKDLMQEYFG